MTAAAASSASTAITIVVGILTSKAAAVFLGPEGVGTVAQLAVTLALLATVCTLGMGIGIRRYVAQYNAQGEEAKLKGVLLGSAFLVTACSVFVTAAGLGVAGRVSTWLFGDERYTWFVAIGIIALPFLALRQSLGEFIYGLRDSKLYLLTTAIPAAVCFLIYVPVVYMYRLNGAVTQLLITAAIGASAVLIGLRWRHGHIFSRSLFKRPIHFGVVTSVLVIGAASLIMTASRDGVMLFLRSLIVDSFGLEANGLYQAAYGFCNPIMTLVLGFQALHSFPRMSETSDLTIIHRETNLALRLTLILMTVVTALIILFRHLAIPLFFAPSFAPAAELLLYQAIGNLCYASGLALGLAILPVGGTKPWIYQGMSFLCIYLVLAIALSRIVGVEAIPVSYTIASIWYFANGYLLMRRFAGYTLSSPLARLMLLSVALIGLVGAISDNTPLSYGVGTVGLLVWGILVLSREDWRNITTMTRNWRS